MKKLITLFALLVSASAYAAQVDPLWRLQLQRSEAQFNIAETLGIESWPQIEAEPLIRVLVKTNDTELTADRIRSCGGKVRNIVNGIITAALPARVLESEAALWHEAEYVEAVKQVSPKNDLANTNTQVTVVQSGTGLPYGYDGTGVIIGILDTGIDLTHPDFKSPSGRTRILYLWDQTDPTGPAPTEFESSYGTEYTQAQIDEGGVPEKDTQGHGTHVAGTAGGRETSYSGVAPKASFIIVKHDFANSLTDGVDYIFQKAADLGMPVVVNLSLGSDSGPHDGTTLEEQLLDRLVAEVAGRVVVAAAGNSGDEEPSSTVVGGYHARFGVATGDVSRAKFNDFLVDTTQSIDIWGQQDCVIDLSVDLLNSSDVVVASSDWVASGDRIADVSLGGLVTLTIDRTETVNSQNGKWHSSVLVTADPSYSYANNYLSLNVRGSCQSFDAWIDSGYLFFYDKTGGGWYPGDNVCTAGMPSTAANLLSIGAYTTRNAWVDSSGEPVDFSDMPLNDIASFSSRGPAISPSTQGTKPNLTAPGAFLISALSAQSTPEPEMTIDQEHLAMAGTSMATPHVVGIVALMLQAYPSLTFSEVMDYLQSTARSDSYVGTAPNGDWGWGKVDAFAAVSSVVTDHPSVDDQNITFPGIPAGETSGDYALNKIVVNFPRAVNAAEVNSQNVYVNVILAGSQLSSSTAWAPSSCDANGSVLASTLELTDAQTLEITLSEAIGLGDFAICISPNVKGADGVTFWGKTVQFGTSLPNTGCSLVRTAHRR